MKFLRQSFKKSFQFSSLPQTESQLHFISHSQIKSLEKTLPETLQTQYKNKKIEWKAEKNQNAHMHFSEGGIFAVAALAHKESTIHNHEFLRKNFKSLVKKGAPALHVNLGSLKTDEAHFWIDALVSLTILESWKQPLISKKPPKKEEGEVPEIHFYTNLSPAQFASVVKNAQATAEATNLVRTLAVTAGNHLTPAIYREKAQEFAKSKKLKYEFWDRKELSKKGAGAFLAVTQADPNDQGGIAKLVYKPKSAKSKAVLTLVGKGLCFDTGGYNVKTGSYMYGMNEDMTGSAIALASIGMLADMNFPMEVHAYLALAENHLSPTGFKPNDVVFASNGVSIEVENTDAEGRMVLSDTLALSSKEKPALIIDYATLTGACFRALSTTRSGVFTNRAKMLSKVIEIGEEAGERLWGFPIGDEYEKGLESEIADLRQCASELNADHIYAATFLNHFVDKDVPWIHIDLSAHAHKGGLGLVSSESNGFGVRVTRALAEALLNKSLIKA